MPDGREWDSEDGSAEPGRRQMPKVDIERLGGFAGFGGAGSHLRSRGSLESGHLSASDQAAIDALFAQPPPKGGSARDSFVYRLTRQTTQGHQMIEVPEAHVPEAVKAAVKDELV